MEAPCRIAGRGRPVEGAARRVGRGALRPLGVDLLDQRRHAEKVGEEDPFLPALVAGMADIGQEADRLPPVGRRRPRLADGPVQVPHEQRETGREPAPVPEQPLGDDVGRVVLVELNHPAHGGDFLPATTDGRL